MLAQLGVKFHFHTLVDAKKLTEIDAKFDGVFLGIGLGAIHKLGIAGEELGGVTDALEFIAGYKSGSITSVPAKIAVIGAGNTAIDAANAAVRLGASEVTMVYRRGPEQMSAFAFEYEHAKQEGVKFLWHVAPVAVAGTSKVHALELAKLESMSDGSLVPRQGENFTLAVELIVLAIGQATHTEFLGDQKIKLERGRVVVDRATGQTSVAKYFAGGDCTNGGREVVDAVADGKRAGLAMAVWLGGHHANA
jgi:glutamate synthase (NADPH/NADH) small chain